MEAQKSTKTADKPDTTRDEREESQAESRGRNQGDAERGSVGPKSERKPVDETEEEAKAKAASAKEASKTASRARKTKNNVRKLRTERMMSKAELARRAGLSTLTVDRVERGMPCRMDTKRKILEAMGLRPSDRVMVFGDTPDEDDD